MAIDRERHHRILPEEALEHGRAYRGEPHDTAGELRVEERVCIGRPVGDGRRARVAVPERHGGAPEVEAVLEGHGDDLRLVLRHTHLG